MGILTKYMPSSRRKIPEKSRIREINAPKVRETLKNQDFANVLTYFWACMSSL